MNLTTDYQEQRKAADLSLSKKKKKKKLKGKEKSGKIGKSP